MLHKGRLARSKTGSGLEMPQNRPKSIPERFPSLVWWFANQCWHLWSISEPKSALGSPNELRTRFWADMAPKVSRMLICWNPWISSTCQDISVTQRMEIAFWKSTERSRFSNRVVEIRRETVSDLHWLTPQTPFCRWGINFQSQKSQRKILRKWIKFQFFSSEIRFGQLSTVCWHHIKSVFENSKSPLRLNLRKSVTQTIWFADSEGDFRARRPKFKFFSSEIRFGQLSTVCWHHIKSVFENSKSSLRLDLRKSVTWNDRNRSGISWLAFAFWS